MSSRRYKGRILSFLYRMAFAVEIRKRQLKISGRHIEERTFGIFDTHRTLTATKGLERTKIHATYLWKLYKYMAEQGLEGNKHCLVLHRKL